MENQAIIGMAALASIVIIGMIVVRSLNRFAYLYREQLFDMAVLIVNDRQSTAAEKAYAAYSMDTALDFRSGWTVMRAAYRALKRSVSVSGHISGSLNDRVRYISQRYIVSALAANPVALIIIIPIMLILVIVEKGRAKDAVRDTAVQLPVGYRLAQSHS